MLDGSLAHDGKAQWDLRQEWGSAVDACALSRTVTQQIWRGEYVISTSIFGLGMAQE